MVTAASETSHEGFVALQKETGVQWRSSVWGTWISDVRYC